MNKIVWIMLLLLAACSDKHEPQVDIKQSPLNTPLITSGVMEVSGVTADSGVQSQAPLNIQATFVSAQTSSAVRDTSANDWISMGGVPGLFGSVRSIAVHGNNVYVSGIFPGVNTDLAHDQQLRYGLLATIVAWDGKKWRALASSAPSDCPLSPILAVSPDGSLFAGGVRCIGKARVNHIAKWDGENWATVGEGINGDVNALYFDDQGNLYATGSNFKANGGEESDGGFVTKWDGRTWKLLGSGIEVGYSITGDHGGHIYVAGSFDRVNKIKAHNIAMWDGQSWHAIGKGVGGKAGSADDDSQTAATSVATNSKGKIYAVTSRGLESWSGKQWEVINTHTDAVIDSVFIDKADHIYLGLDSTCNVEGGPSTGAPKPIQYWDGKMWAPFTLIGSNSGISPGCANGGSVSTLASDENGSLYVGGTFVDRSSGAINIAKWNGQTWESLGKNVGVNDIVNQMLVDQDDNLYVRGAFTRVDDIPVARNQIAKWHEGKWAVLKDVKLPIRGMALDSAGSLYIATGEEATSYISKWDGANWNQIATIDYLVQKLFVDDHGRIFTCGFTGDENDHYGILTPHGIDMWDGKSWHPLPPFPDAIGGSSCNLKQLEPNSIYAQRQSGENVWRWSGTDWSLESNKEKIAALAQNPQGLMYRIEREDYNEGRNIIKVWSAGNWVDLGATSGGNIESIAASKEYLYIGGSFPWLNRKPSPYLARYRVTPGAAPAQANQKQQAETPKGYVSQGGLIWMPINFSSKTWADANAYCTNTATNGQTGWRLPTKDELKDLYDSGVMRGQGWTLIDTWSSTPSRAGSHYVVYLGNGFVGANFDSVSDYVTCVR